MSPASRETGPRLSSGADGWRGTIGVGFRLDTVERLAAAVAAVLRQVLGRPEVLVCHDGRLLSPEGAEVAARVLLGSGLPVTVAGELPTPVAAFAVHECLADVAVVVTASHNAAMINGLKLKVAPGVSPDAGLVALVERQLAEGAPVARGAAEPRQVDSRWLLRRHASYVRSLVEARPARGRSPVVVVDGLNGVAGRPLAGLLARLGCEVHALGDHPDPAFGNLVPDPTLEASRQRAANAVRRLEADVGFVLDGDGDRIAVLGPAGGLVEPHHVLAMLLEHEHRRRPRRAGVALTVATGSSVERLAGQLGMPVVRTAVGFKHVAPHLVSGQAWFGGGAVGDAAIRPYSFDRDPAVVAVKLLEACWSQGCDVGALRDRLAARFGATIWAEALIGIPPPAPGELERVAHEALRVVRPAATTETAERADGARVRANGAWLLLRPASTERGVRAYFEVERPDERVQLLAAVRQRLRAAAGGPT